MYSAKNGDCEDYAIAKYLSLGGVGDDGDLVVEDQRLAVDLDHQDRVRHPEIHVLDHQDPHLVLREADGAEREILGDRVVLAVAVLGEELGGGGPIILLAPIDGIEDVSGLIVERRIIGPPPPDAP